MKSRRSHYIPSKRMVSGFGSAFIVMGTLFILPNTAGAQVRSINMPEEMCDVLREEPLNQRILRQIRGREDYAEILEYVEETCGDLGGLLIGPTGTTLRTFTMDNATGGPGAPIATAGTPAGGEGDNGNGDGGNGDGGNGDGDNGDGDNGDGDNGDGDNGDGDNGDGDNGDNSNEDGDNGYNSNEDGGDDNGYTSNSDNHDGPKKHKHKHKRQKHNGSK